MKRTRRSALLVLATAAPMLLASGCGVFSEATTQHPAQLADGISTQVGAVDVRDLLVVGDKGSEGLVSGALVNNGDQEVVVTVSTQGAPQPVNVPVPAGGVVTLGGQDSGATVVVADLTVAAGQMIPVQLSSPAGGQVQITVPVLAPRFAYATVTPPPN